MIKDHTGLRRISIFLFFAALVLLVVHIQILSMFNRKELSIHGNDSSSNAYMEIESRANSTSKWLKRDFQLADGQTADLTGQTIDETLYNNSGDMIRDWQLRVNIAGDCFINQSWLKSTSLWKAAGKRCRNWTCRITRWRTSSWNTAMTETC